MIILNVLVIPVLGVVVRYRATYYPLTKLVVVDAELNDGPIPFLPVSTTKPSLPTTSELESTAKDTPPSIQNLHTEAGKSTKIEIASVGPHPALEDPPTFWRVWRNVWRHAKFEGLYTGYLPQVVLSILTSRIGMMPTPLPYYDDKIRMLFFNVVYMYYLIAAYRVIVSPHKFELAKPKSMYRQTFTEYERSHPFRLLQYSGIVAPFMSSVVFFYFYQNIYLKSMQLPADFPTLGEGEQWYKLLNELDFWYALAIKVALPFDIAILATLLWTPVHVIMTRLAIQPVHGPPSSLAEDETEKLVDLGIIAAPSYLQLTTEQRPYEGFKDCFQRTVKEEGWGALYRSWWLSFVSFYIPFI